MRLPAALVAFAAVVNFATAAKLPPSYVKCTVKTSEFGRCFSSTLQKVLQEFLPGQPDFDIPQLEPFHIPYVKIPSTGRNVVVEQSYRNVVLHGYKDMQIEDVSFDTAKNLMTFKLRFPLVRFDSDYDVKGKVFVLPVEGTGRSEIIMKNLRAIFTLDLETLDRAGDKYFHAAKSHITAIPEHVSYKYENLFNGNKKLGDEINKVLNENWRDVYDDVKDGYGQIVAQINQDMINKIFAKIPIRDLFIGYI